MMYSGGEDRLLDYRHANRAGSGPFQTYITIGRSHAEVFGGKEATERHSRECDEFDGSPSINTRFPAPKTIVRCLPRWCKHVD